MDKMTERIHGPALKRGEDVYADPIPASHFSLSETIKRLLHDDTLTPLKWKQGFITSSGRYVDRKEAKVIAAAAGQIVNPITGSANLLSEELWSEAVAPVAEKTEAMTIWETHTCGGKPNPDCAACWAKAYQPLEAYRTALVERDQKIADLTAERDGVLSTSVCTKCGWIGQPNASESSTFARFDWRCTNCGYHVPEPMSSKITTLESSAKEMQSTIEAQAREIEDLTRKRAGMVNAIGIVMTEAANRGLFAEKVSGEQVKRLQGYLGQVDKICEDPEAYGYIDAQDEREAKLKAVIEAIAASTTYTEARGPELAAIVGRIVVEHDEQAEEIERLKAVNANERTIADACRSDASRVGEENAALREELRIARAANGQAQAEIEVQKTRATHAEEAAIRWDNQNAALREELEGLQERHHRVMADAFCHDAHCEYDCEGWREAVEAFRKSHGTVSPRQLIEEFKAAESENAALREEIAESKKQKQG